MALVRKRMEEMGGDISLVASDRGAVFVLNFPLAQAT